MSRFLSTLARASASRLMASGTAFAPASRAIAHWTHVPMGPKDPILGVAENFKV